MVVIGGTQVGCRAKVSIRSVGFHDWMFTGCERILEECQTD